MTVPFTCVKEEREVFLRLCGLPGITAKIDGKDGFWINSSCTNWEIYIKIREELFPGRKLYGY